MSGPINDDGDGPDDPFDFAIPPAKPTQRRIEVLVATALGLQPKEVGALFFISPSTVNTHLSEIRSAFNMRTTLEAFVYAQYQGWITSDDINALRVRIRRWREEQRMKV
jgi:DNA-binding NarL/FixJ family response regulator